MSAFHGVSLKQIFTQSEDFSDLSTAQLFPFTVLAIKRQNTFWVIPQQQELDYQGHSQFEPYTNLPFEMPRLKSQTREQALFHHNDWALSVPLL